MEKEMTCSKCGGKMMKIDDTTMKCEGCGTTVTMDEMKDGEKEV